MAEPLEIEITDLAHDGRGVGRHQGTVVFLAGAIPGDRVLARPEKRSRRSIQARLERILRPSEHRRRPPCILADACGGCSLQALADEAQLAWKHNQVVQALQRIAALRDPVAPVLACPRPLGYRNRAVIPLERTDAGVLRAGYYRRGSHRIVNMNRCPVLDPRLDALVRPLKGDLEASRWPVDRHARSAEGGLRHLALRLGHHSGQVLITLISSHERLPGLEERARRWMERWPALVGVGLNLQPHPTNRLMGETTRAVQGRTWLEEGFAGLHYRIGADTFFQVNTPQAERLVPIVRQMLGPSPGRLVDAYCGIGTYSLPIAAAGWRVLGIEHHAGAVGLARHNALQNGLERRARFEQAAVAEVLAARLAGCQALFVDPPRRGLEPRALAAIRQAGVPRLLYLSCDPATLARDLSCLCAEGPYRVRRVQPIDFFPHTSHIETLVALETG